MKASGKVTRARRGKKRGGALLVLAALLGWSASSAAGTGGDASLGWFADHSNGTRAVLERVANGQQGVAGARQLVQGRQLRPLSPADVARLARDNSLVLQQQRHTIQSAEHGIQVAKAAFDPTFSLSASQSSYRTWGRSEMIGRMRTIEPNWEKFQDAMESLNWEDTQTVTCVRVDGEPVSGSACEQNLEYRVEQEWASTDSEYWVDSATFGVAAYQPLPWGGGVSASVSSSFYPYKSPKWATISALERARDLGMHEWSSYGSLSLTTPLPFTKGFGDDGNYSQVNEDVAELSRDSARATYQELANSAVRQALESYWGLVRGLLAVEAATGRVDVARARVERTQRLLRADRATEYDLLQAESDLASARNQEEIAWYDWIAASQRLAELLDLPEGEVVAPDAFLEALPRALTVDDTATLDRALSQRATVKARRLDLAAQERMADYRRQQLLPDVSFSASFSSSQSTAVYGYATLGDSLDGLSSPDSTSFYLGITLTYPLGNEAVKAAHVSALASRDQAWDTLQSSRMQITAEANAALALARSSGAQVRLAERGLALAQAAYDTAERLHEAGRATAFELIQRHQDLHSARVALADALVNRRIAAVRIAAAEGRLGQGGPPPGAEATASKGEGQ